MKRRRFLRHSLFGAGGLGTGLGLYALQVEPHWVELVKRDMPFRQLPRHLRGKRVMHISDLHVGNRFDYTYLVSAMRDAQRLQPDYAVYTGDFVSYEDAKQFDQLAQVLPYTVCGREGTFAVLGNHDYGENWAEPEVANRIAELLEVKGDMQVLRNEKVTTDGGLDFYGLDDYWGTNFNPKAALADYDSRHPAIALCHNPDVCDLPVWGDFTGWILAGHTHGGQVKPPFLPPPLLPVENRLYSAGSFDLGLGRHLYINRALGHLWPVRFNVRPEITLFTLTEA